MAEEDSRQELIEYFCSLSFVHETEDGPSDETRSVSLCVRACVCVRVRAWVRVHCASESLCARGPRKHVLISL